MSQARLEPASPAWAPKLDLNRFAQHQPKIISRLETANPEWPLKNVTREEHLTFTQSFFKI